MNDYEYLVDRNEIAHLLGVGPTAVSNYVARTSVKHPPFPEAVIVRAKGRFRLWNLIDVMLWHSMAFPKRVVDFDMRRLRTYRKDQS
jgi:hypothetical protein